MSTAGSKPDPRKPGLTPQEHENLSAYLDQELDEVDTEAVTAALSRRPEVRREAESLRKTWELLDYLPKPHAAKSFTEQTLTRLNSTKGILLQQGMKWRRYAIAGWAACVVTAAAFGFWLTYSLGREPEIVEVQSPVTDVLPVMDATPPETHHVDEQKTVPKKDRLEVKAMQRTQKEISQQRNERLTREIGKVLLQLRKEMSEEEKDRLLELSRKGGLPYLDKVLELAHKYKIPLVDHNDSSGPAKTNKKTVGKGKEAGE